MSNLPTFTNNRKATLEEQLESAEKLKAQPKLNSALLGPPPEQRSLDDIINTQKEKLQDVGNVLSEPTEYDELDTSGYLPTQQMAGQGAWKAIRAALALQPKEEEMLTIGNDPVTGKPMRFDPTGVIGSVRSRYPFNPSKIDDETIKNLDQWVMEGVSNARKKLPNMGQNEKFRALHKLHGETDVRINPETGEREFKLFRGMGPQEAAQWAETGSLDSPSSWTPRIKIAERFKNTNPDETAETLEAWIPESAIKSVPYQYGQKTGLGFGENKYKGEKEIIISPKSKINPKTYDKSNDNISKSIDEKIAVREIEEKIKQEALKKEQIYQDVIKKFAANRNEFLDLDKLSEEQLKEFNRFSKKRKSIEKNIDRFKDLRERLK